MNGQVSPPGGPPLATHSGSIVSPYLIGTDGWALFVHRPSGEFDLRAERARLIPRKDTAGREPLEVFVVALQEPADAVAGYYRLTGKPVLPLDPVRQYAAQPADGPTTIRVYPGRDGESRLYEDDGESPEYARGKFTRTRLKWDEGPPAGDRAGLGGRVPGR